MSFTDYIYVTVQNLKSSLQAGLNAFFDAQKDGQIEYSKQAFSKGRKRIKPEAFQELFQSVVDSFYEKAELADWKGYQLFGIDGTRLNLPCTNELAELYGIQTSQGAPQVQALVSCMYDLLNGMIVDTRFAHCRSSERAAAKDMIGSFRLQNVSNPVFIMDRGYPAAELRFLSKESAHWAAEVMAGYGFRPYVINRSSPTPLMMFMVKTRAMPYGIAVTASHNPAIYNGIKVFTAGGRDADRTVTDKIEAEIAQINPDTIKSMDYDAAVAAGMITEHNPTNEHIDSILSAIDVEAIKNAQLRIALDPMYGVSQTSLSMILMTCRCDLEIIHDRHDTLFGGKLPAPNEDTLGPQACASAVPV
ncbi:MAG: hypothetical protein U0O42_07685 [Oscillospiraceae bacterium]